MLWSIMWYDMIWLCGEYVMMYDDMHNVVDVSIMYAIVNGLFMA